MKPWNVGKCIFPLEITPSSWKRKPARVITNGSPRFNFYTPGSKDLIPGRWGDLDAILNTRVYVLSTWSSVTFSRSSLLLRWSWDRIKTPTTRCIIKGPGFMAGWVESLAQKKHHWAVSVWTREAPFSTLYIRLFSSSQMWPSLSQHQTFVYSPGDCHENRCKKEIRPNMDILAFLGTRLEPMDMFRYEQVS
jgi:hypothetical protein